MGKALRLGAAIGALLGLWISSWPALLWWASISGWLYGDAPSARSRQMLADAANAAWAHGRSFIGLGAVTQPLGLVVCATVLGAILGAYCAAVISLLRIDRAGRVRDTLLWLATPWRHPRAVVWFAALVVVATVFYITAMPITFGVDQTLPFAVRIAGINLLAAFLGFGVPLLLVRRTVLGPEPRVLGTVREFGLANWRTWLAIILPVAVGFIRLPLVVVLLAPLIAAIASQLLIGRAAPPQPWIRTLAPSRIGAFYLMGFYLLLVLLVILAPVATITLLNVYGTPPILWVYQHEKLALPFLYAAQLTSSEYVVSYWWAIAPQLLVPLYWLLTGRLAWTFLPGPAQAPASTIESS